jgi:hypothetical protein
MTKDYQLMMFDGCTTFHYVDDLRAAPGKDSKNLDLVVSTGLLPWSTGSADVLRMLDGVTEGQSINEVKAGLEEINKDPGSKTQLWMADGFNDN